MLKSSVRIIREYTNTAIIVWTVQEEALRKQKQEMLRQGLLDAKEAEARKEAMRRESGLSSN